MTLRGLFMALCLLASSCGSEPSMTAAQRSVRIETTACGNASGTSGGAVIVGEGLVIAAAHVVFGAGEIELAGPDGRQRADIIVLDTRSDLALLEVDDLAGVPVETASADSGDEVVMATQQGFVEASILRRVEVRIEEVGSTVRNSRLGYEVDRGVELGDSGGGVFDDDGALIGVIFGRPQGEAGRSFIVRQEELETLLAADRTTVWSCDPELHRVVEIHS